jgi:hypothetical protein
MKNHELDKRINRLSLLVSDPILADHVKSELRALKALRKLHFQTRAKIMRETV